MIRGYARLVSGLVLLTFVLCHLTSHIFLLVSLPIADKALVATMWFWRSDAGSIHATGPRARSASRSPRRGGCAHV